MARKKKHDDREMQEVGGFVPATANSQPLHKHGRHSIDLDAADREPSVSGMPGATAAPEVVNQYSRSTADYSHRKKSGMSRGAKVALTILVIVVIAAAAAAGVYFFREAQKAQINQDLHSMEQEELEAVDNELTGMTTFDEPFTMLLLGSDERADDPDMGARTDTIILVRIDPLQNIISMVSIPRDTKVQLPGVGVAKFNAAYAYGGPSGTIAAVKELCGVDIDHYAEINFEGLVGLVDAIGGIDVYVDEVIDDPDAGDAVIPAGEQHLDGAAALTFSRSRAYVDGDFTRVSNQRKVIEAIIHKGLEAPASELYGLVKASAAFLTTDSGMDVDFIYSLADQIRHNNDYPITLYTATIPATTAMENGVSYVIADKAGVADMIEVFLEGGDVSGNAVAAPEDAGSISGGEDGHIPSVVRPAVGSSSSSGSSSASSASSTSRL